jgi:hypothetical protein
MSDAGVVRGMLPVLAASSIPHSLLRHEIGDPVAWANEVRGPAWTVACRVVGALSTHKCADRAATTFAERLGTWCAVTRSVERVAAAGATVHAHAAAYERVHTAGHAWTPGHAAATRPRVAAHGDAATAACLAEFAPPPTA